MPEIIEVKRGTKNPANPNQNLRPTGSFCFRVSAVSIPEEYANIEKVETKQQQQQQHVGVATTRS